MYVPAAVLMWVDDVSQLDTRWVPTTFTMYLSGESLIKS